MLVRSRHNLPLRRLATVGTSILNRAPSAASLRPWRQRTRSGRHVAFERNLATALDNLRTGEEISYDGFVGSIPSGFSTPSHGFYELQGFDGFSPLQLSEPLPPVATKRSTASGMPGRLEETIALYDACIKVGRLDRAAMVLKRIATFNVLSARDMMELHNRYLREKLAHMQAEPGRSKADDLHKWFELEIRGELLPMVPETIAYMLKASFLTAKDKRLETLVKRYMGMLPDDAGLGELHLGDILSDQELSTITQICPVYSLAYESPSYATFEDYPQDGEMDIPLEAAELAMEAEPSETPDVLSTPQKGMGLKAIKRSLSLFDNIKDGNVIANLSPSEQREIQSRLERDCIDSAMERWREENQALQSMGLNTATSNAKLSPKLHEWHTALQARIEEEFKLIDQSMSATKKTAEDLSRCLYGPFILQSTPKRLAAVTILSMLSSIGSEKGVAVSTSVQHIAKVVEEDIRVQRKEKQRAAQRAKARKAKLLRKAQAAQNLAQTGSLNAQAPSVLAERQVAPAAPGAPIADRLQVEDRYDIKDLETNGYWPSTIRVKVGAVLLSAMCESARITAVKENPETGALISQSQPAFVHGCKLKKGKKVGMIMANPVVENLVRQEPRGDFLARHLPMVVEPESWSKWDKGGYIESSTPLVRVKFGEAEQRIYTQAALHRGDMKQMLKGMDVLGKTGWKINRPVFNVMLEVWNSGKEFGSIPPLEPDVKYPPEPETHDDPSLRSLWVRAMKAADNEKCSLHSIRCNMNFQMEVAKAFRDQTFYFPHNVDFRGRAYPIPTYLNHMGADNVRGLLRFAKGKPLGEKGLRWLKVHMANVYGFDKASLDQREQFAMEHLDDIYDSAMNPLSGRMWWKEAEDPWQCLAACYELKAALDSADPTKFVSHLPIHQDGTCNGLQHYAALGGDTWGAKQVNLEPGDRPADVYSAVAQLVQESIAKDAAAGQEFALAVDGKIKRKVVKQTVMTNVYGVTFAGARKQILKQLDALYPNLRSETGQDPNVLASYIARKVFGALSTMFGGAHDIQKWLGAIGGRVCRAVTPEQIRIIAQESSVLSTPKAKRNWSGKPTLSTELLSQFRSTLVWTTPLRMPVVQPYRTSSAQTVATCIQDLVLTQSDRSDPVNQRKQLQAFPPNFIHSLDASHMILSALGCDARGLSFAAVHDSFWTHASDVDTMNEVLRDAFIRIHSDDVIGRLAEEFKMRYKGSMYLAKIPASSKMGKQILQLRKSYTTPITMKDELVMEHQRRLLLESDDAESKIKGEAMTTPSSIYEELQSEGDTELALRADDAMTFAEASEAEETADSTQDPGAAAQMPAVDVVADEAPPSAEGETAFSSTLKRMSDGNYFGHAIKGMRTKAPAQTKERDSVQVWLPLTFPAIPPKGDFDVKRLRQSQYFFS